MTEKEAIKDAKIRAKRSGMTWYVVEFDYGFDCVTEHYICKGSQVKTNKTVPNLKYRLTKKDKELLDTIINNLKHEHSI